MLGQVLTKLAPLCVAGNSTWEIDMEAEKLIKAFGGRPAFKGYQTHAVDRPFPATVCASINEELVHGMPGKEIILKDGDILSLDIGMEWPAPSKKEEISRHKRNSGVFTDTAITLPIGKITPEAKRLLLITRQALEEAIAVCRPGASIAAIGKAIENYVNTQGKYGIVRELVGHGVGHKVHEEPYIPNYYDKKLESSILKPGMVIAIEPMIAIGHWKVETLKDGWTIKMADNSLCAHSEHTVIITETGNVVATRRKNEGRELSNF